MNSKVEIVNNSGEKAVVSKEFAEAFNKSKKRTSSLGSDFGKDNEIPIEEFEEDSDIKKSTLQDRMQSEHSVGVKTIKEGSPKVTEELEEFDQKVYDEIVREKEVKKSEEDQINGGIGDSQDISSIAKKHKVSEDDIKEQLRMGIKVEMEHTDSRKKATEIAIDHLTEFPDYYTALAEMEKMLKKKHGYE